MDGEGWQAASDSTGPRGDHDQELQIDRIAQSLAVVLLCLREHFPSDYYRRCAFAARGLRTLLDREGVPSRAVGGRFSALVVAKFGTRYALQGFEDGPEVYPHLWVETADRMIDLGPHLLPFGSPFPVVPMPLLMWSKSEPLPAALRYEAIAVVPDDAPFSIDPDVARQGEAFATLCLERCHSKIAAAYWFATGQAALDQHPEDPWVMGVRHFEHVVRKLPHAPH